MRLIRALIALVALGAGIGAAIYLNADVPSFLDNHYVLYSITAAFAALALILIIYPRPVVMDKEVDLSWLGETPEYQPAVVNWSPVNE